MLTIERKKLMYGGITELTVDKSFRLIDIIGTTYDGKGGLCALFDHDSLVSGEEFTFKFFIAIMSENTHISSWNKPDDINIYYKTVDYTASSKREFTDSNNMRVFIQTEAWVDRCIIYVNKLM